VRRDASDRLGRTANGRAFVVGSQPGKVYGLALGCVEDGGRIDGSERRDVAVAQSPQNESGATDRETFGEDGAS